MKTWGQTLKNYQKYIGRLKFSIAHDWTIPEEKTRLD